jgi:hypothetical protein
MIAPWEARRLRNTPANTLVEEYGAYTASQFDRTGVPVVIAARNEQEDLPATLVSLANSERPVMPYIIENGSEDETANRARSMGAVVLRCSDPYKMAALQLGVKFLAEEVKLEHPILFTDADTLVGKKWSRLMSVQAESEKPTVLCGASVFAHGPSKVVDALRTGNALAKDTLLAVRDRSPNAKGHNMSVNFAHSEEALLSYLAIEKRLFIREELKIVREIIATGGEVRRELGWQATVLTRGDRFASIAQCMATRGDPDDTSRRELYRPDYGNDFI